MVFAVGGLGCLGKHKDTCNGHDDALGYRLATVPPEDSVQGTGRDKRDTQVRAIAGPARRGTHPGWHPAIFLPGAIATEILPTFRKDEGG